MNLLITGGSRGLGLEVVRQQLDLGHQLWVVSRTNSTDLNHLLTQHADACRHLPIDLAASASAIRQSLSVGLGDVAIHGVVNNSAVAYDDLVTNLNPEVLERMFRVNVFGVMEVARFAIRNMLLHQVAGSLVHVSSICAHRGSKGLSMYAATKGAVEAFSINVAQEWGSRGIRSNCVVPGFMKTEMSAGLSEDQLAAIANRSALRRLVDVAGVASAVDYLLSDRSRSVTGQNWIVDCGGR